MTPREPPRDLNGQSPEPVVPRAQLDLMAYLDGELEAESVAAVEERLRSDVGYAAQLRELRALGDFLRDDADRIYARAKLDDAFLDATVQRTRAIARESAASPPDARRDGTAPRSVIPFSEYAPPTSRATRARKNAAIWISFGGIAAAAAALFFYLRAHETPKNTEGTAQTAPAVQDTVAVKTPTPASSLGQEGPPKAPAALDEASVEIESLEVGQGATVIYTREKGGANAVVWVNETH